MILFGNGTAEALKHLDEATFLDVFEGVPRYEVPKVEIEAGIPFGTLCTDKAAIFASKGELRRLIAGGGISLNRAKITDMEASVSPSELIAGKYLLVQKGKKNYYLIVAK
jgi:tyrosyl-tRNA synthetase